MKQDEVPKPAIKISKAEFKFLEKMTWNPFKREDKNVIKTITRPRKFRCFANKTKS